jgi:hypothetical protein
VTVLDQPIPTLDEETILDAWNRMIEAEPVDQWNEALADLTDLDRQLHLAAWQYAVEEFLPKSLGPYAEDPVGWVREKLGEHLWSKQRDIANSVVTHRKTAVKSCHDAGKSFIASRIAQWWIDIHPPGTALVVSTAPTYQQVHAILWEEIRNSVNAAAARGAKLPGRVLLSDEWKLDDGRIVGFGRKPANTNIHGFQGHHRRYVLVIVDEACGVPQQLWTAIEAITTGDDCRILAIGNPDDPGAQFAKVCRPGSGWNVIGISAYDTPNFTDEPVPESLRPLLLSQSWVVDKEKTWGRASPWFTSKVLGEFPEIGEKILIPPAWILAAQNRILDPGPWGILGVDVARFGSDRTVLTLRRGPVVRVLSDHSKLATTQTTGEVVVAVAEHDIDEIRVDGVGVGGGVVDQLVEQGYTVVDMQAGAAPADPKRFLNARAEWYWALRQRFEHGTIDIDAADDDTAAQLGAIRFGYTSRGQIKIESKDEMKERGLPSPDRADTLMLVAADDLTAPDEIVEDPEDDFPGISSY